ncbi:MAG: lamin tail domain-containing protein, partial [Bacteroidales bacterium]|nr:lamin tail domain-containing protein [Bacteroidales bacterium]
MNIKKIYIASLFIALFGTLSAQVFINEYSASNLSSFTDNYGQYEDWFELYNSSENSVDIGGYYLSDNMGNPLKWQFPDGIVIPAQDFIKIWCTGRDEVSGNNFHTNFRLTQTKDNPE